MVLMLGTKKEVNLIHTVAILVLPTNTEENYYA